MTNPIQPGPDATTTDLDAALERDRLIASELPRVRAAATAWRNGLAGLLTALIGFGLVKGRSDVTELDSSWAVVVGVGLLIALFAGAAGALLLMRAANGRPSIVPLDQVIDRLVADHNEALAAATSLRRGIASVLLCTGFLVAAVAVTWYAPAAADPVIQVTDDHGTHCGTALKLTAHGAGLDTESGPVAIDASNHPDVAAKAKCP